jgi:hypothetical protein
VIALQEHVPLYVIAEGRLDHVPALVRVLREEDRQEVKAFGYPSAFRAIMAEVRRSHYCKTAYVRGQVAVMWGVAGPLIGESRLWLMTSPLVEYAPMAMVKEGRKEISQILLIHPVLCGHVQARYSRAVRFLGLLGFAFGESEDWEGEAFLPYRIER